MTGASHEDPVATAADPEAASLAVPGPRCRFCRAPLRHTVVDLGMSPLCESFLVESALDQMEPFYPLHVRVCEACLLVQLEQFVAPEEIFTEYAYFSAYAESWVEHARRYVDAIVERLGLGAGSFVVELASNDGYLLQHLVAKGVPALGIEPAHNVAAAARERGVETLEVFFGVDAARQVAAERGHADLIVGNNVFAHVPDLNDFTAGIAILLAPTGVLTLEFPHLLRLIEGNQFDTIYHEHFCYYTFTTARTVLVHHGLEVFDVEEIPTHGGSLRVFAQPAAGAHHEIAAAVGELLRHEEDLGYRTLEPYASFRQAVEETKRDLLDFLIGAKREGKSVVGYGAPGKGNTLLNYCGIRTDFLEYTVDRNPYKHGRFTPGTHIPIHPVERIAETRPDIVLILPWNLRDEIAAQLSYVAEWGGRLIVPIPRVEVVA